jgi:alanyl aminopeptidase
VLAPKGLGGLAGEAAALTPPLLAALEDYFGRRYPYEKLDLIAVPEYWPGAMENPGLITFADDILLHQPGAVSAGQRRHLARVNAHEIAHMWFGDLVTMQWWDDLWLNESFADWMGNKVTDQLFPELETDLSMLRGVQGILGVDARPTTPAIRQPIVHPEESMGNVGLAYAKGRAVLGMVEQWLGEEAFRRAVRTYVDRHADGNTVAADLWRALAEASGEDVAAVLASFVDQPGYPLLTVTPEEGSVRVEQRRFLNHGVEAPAQRWRVPVVLKYARGGEVETRRLLLDAESARVDLGGGVDWVMPNAGAQGYYRWQVPEAMLLELAAAAPAALDPEERIELLGDTAALLDAGAVGGGTYLEVLGAFADDPHPDVVSALVANLSKVEGAFVPDELRGPFARYVRRTLGPALARFGMEPRPGEPEAVALFRPQLLGWLGGPGDDPEVLAYATRLADAYVADPASVDPALAGVALGLAARKGDQARFDTYRRHFEASTAPNQREHYLEALGAFEEPAVQDKALAYVLEGPVRPTELFTIPGGVGSTPGGDERMFDWIVGHYEALTSRMPKEFIAFMPFIASGCSAERLARAREFFARPENRVEGTEVQLAKVAQQVGDCVELRRREGESVAAFLRAES